MDWSRQSDALGRKIALHGAEGFEGMRRAGDLAARTLDFVAPHIRLGVSTLELDGLCDQFMRDHGAVAATIGYRGYRHASCISVNHVATHGIPSADKVLRDGDTLNIDVTPLLDGWHGDTSRMFTVGEVSIRSRRLIRATHEAMWNAIKLVRPGATVGDLGWAMESTARAYGFRTVRVFCGHGVGRVFHDAPDILFYGRPGEGVVLEPGMIFTIEPMVNAGRAEVTILPDGWTTVTRDRAPSAQFEHSVGVTEDGVEVFTLGSDRPPAGEPYTAPR
ncbi:MAG TPA: type I methionyl aminopeptidase [Caulobacteraceae bacterium]|nr:type I methionyl aminopeptidase [Caulobacteraceae bacterium]